MFLKGKNLWLLQSLVLRNSHVEDSKNTSLYCYERGVYWIVLFQPLEIYHEDKKDARCVETHVVFFNGFYMYTTILHDLRRYLRLSLTEYCVLDAIYHLQNKEKYDFWCVASHERIANNLGISQATVKRCYNTLLKRGYIKEGGLYKGKTKKVRVSQNECDLFNHSRRAKTLVFEDEESSDKEQNPSPPLYLGQIDPGDKNSDPPPRSECTRYLGQNDLQYIQYINNELPKGNCDTGSLGEEKKEKKQYGSVEINKMLDVLKSVVGCEDFRESQKQQRYWGNTLVTLKKKIGVEEFKHRVAEILSNDFKRSNSASLQYLYKEIKSFITL